MTARLFDVAGKVVLITGGTSGIGLMIARGFVRAGARVYVNSRNAEAVTRIAEQLSIEGECHGLAADVSDEMGIRALATGLAERERWVHVLINNAGATWGAPLESYPVDRFDHVMCVNVRGPFLVSVALLSLLRNAAKPDDPARIVNISSLNGTDVAHMESYAYPASKAALNALTRQLAWRLARENINVNAIAPGPFPTRMVAFVKQNDERWADVLGSVPLRRAGDADDAAGTAIFLSSRASAYITGAVIPLDGGLSGIGRISPAERSESSEPAGPATAETKQDQ